jgi:penicillin-binding protein 2
MAVVVEHGGSGSGVAAPIAHDIMYEVLKRDPTQRQAYMPPDADPNRGRG